MTSPAYINAFGAPFHLERDLFRLFGDLEFPAGGTPSVFPPLRSISFLGPAAPIFGDDVRSRSRPAITLSAALPLIDLDPTPMHGVNPRPG